MTAPADPFAAVLDSLADRIADRVVARLADGRNASRAEAGGHLLDRRGVAGLLGCCVDVVDRLRGQGMPELRVGDAPRFEPDRVLEWLRERKSPRSPSGETALGARGNHRAQADPPSLFSMRFSARTTGSEQVRAVTGNGHTSRPTASGSAPRRAKPR
jgi:hypothetical protein